MEISLSQRTELTRHMDRISRAATDIKRAARTFTIREVTYKQMDTIISFATEAAAIMDSLKPQPEQDKQGILIDLDSEDLVRGKVVLIPHEPDEAVEQEVRVNE